MSSMHEFQTPFGFHNVYENAKYYIYHIVSRFSKFANTLDTYSLPFPDAKESFPFPMYVHPDQSTLFPPSPRRLAIRFSTQRM